MIMKTRFFYVAVLLVFIASTINSQTLTSIDPDNGEQCQQLTLTLTGENTNFYQGTSSLWLEMGNTTIFPASNTVISSDQISGVFFFNPQHIEGTYDVHAYNGSGSGDMVLPESFTLNPVANLPQLLNSEPNTATLGDVISLLITAENSHFDEIGINNSVWLNSENGGYFTSTSVNVIDSDHLEATIEISIYAPAGNYHLHVKNALDNEITLENALVVQDNGNSPQIVLVDPNSASQGQTLTISVTGNNTNFQQGSSMLRLKKNSLGTISPISFNVINDTLISSEFAFNFDHNPGIYDVTVINWGLGDITLVDGFTLLESAGSPSLSSITPGISILGKAVTLEIKAENTQFDAEGNNASVSLINGSEELYGNSIYAIDSVTLKADFVFSYANYTGYRNLVVSTPLEGEMILNNALYIMDSLKTPGIVSVVPDTAMQKDILEISVSGSDIVFMPGTSSLMLIQGNLTLTPISQEIESNTVIKGVFEFAEYLPTGKYDVLVEGDYAWPNAVLTDGFTLKLFDFIGETKSHALLTVYPNPSNGLLNVKRNFKDKGLFLLTVYDINGRFVLEDRIEIDENEKQLNLNTFPKGSYFLKVQFGDNKQTEQFLIK